MAQVPTWVMGASPLQSPPPPTNAREGENVLIISTFLDVIPLPFPHSLPLPSFLTLLSLVLPFPFMWGVLRNVLNNVKNSHLHNNYDDLII